MTDRPTPPDEHAGHSIHRPGRAPGVDILDGPATMRVGARKDKPKTSSTSSSSASSSSSGGKKTGSGGSGGDTDTA